MEPRIKYPEVAPEARESMKALETCAGRSDLESSVLELVRLRASQINGCAYCIDVHTKDAPPARESEQRIYALTVRRQTPFYSDRDRAALAWTEAVTQVVE